MNQSMVSFMLFLIFFAASASCDDIFDEMEENDYLWPVAEVSETSNITDMDCYREIGRAGIGHVFKLHLGLTEKTKYRCIIKLPTPVDIQFIQLNFAHHKTAARLLAGNSRSRPVLWSPLLTNANPKSDYGEFTVQCLHGFIVVLHSNPSDTLTFLVKAVDENAPIITEKDCNQPRETLNNDDDGVLVTRGQRRTLFF